MKALILAAGKGSNLYPLTETRPKPMFSICGKPVLEYIIQGLVETGIHDITMVIGQHGETIKNYFHRGERFGVNIQYIVQDEPLGLAHALKCALPWVDGDDVLMYLGDNLLEQDLHAFVAAFEGARTGTQPPAAQILLKEVDDPHRFGIAKMNSEL